MAHNHGARRKHYLCDYKDEVVTSRITSRRHGNGVTDSTSKVLLSFVYGAQKLLQSQNYNLKRVTNERALYPITRAHASGGSNLKISLRESERGVVSMRVVDGRFKNLTRRRQFDILTEIRAIRWPNFVFSSFDTKRLGVVALDLFEPRGRCGRYCIPA